MRLFLTLTLTLCTQAQVRVDMDKGDRVEADSASARGRSQKRSSVVAGPEEAGSGGGHVKCVARPGLTLTAPDCHLDGPGQ